MGPRTRLALLAALSLLGAGLWWGSVTAPSLDLPDYTVLNRLPGGEATADVLIPSLSRGDERRQEICRAVAATESLEMAFIFSTEDALEAHQAHLPSPDERDALKAGDSPGTGAGWRVHAGGRTSIRTEGYAAARGFPVPLSGVSGGAPRSGGAASSLPQSPLAIGGSSGVRHSVSTKILAERADVFDCPARHSVVDGATGHVDEFARPRDRDGCPVSGHRVDRHRR